MTSELPPDLEQRLAGLEALSEPTRRALYLFVVRAGAPVTRDAAAAGVGVARNVAAFHLDRLAEDGLLRTEFRRLSGRQGPGAGRPSKLYARHEEERSVSLPPRGYQLAAEILAAAVEAGAAAARRALDDAAAARGRQMGEGAASRLPPRAGRARRRDAVLGVLAAEGYEPYPADDGLRLRNCPFHGLADAHRDLVCGMNHRLLAGVLAAAGCSDLEARLDPRPGECCVVIAPRTPPPRADQA